MKIFEHLEGLASSYVGVTKTVLSIGNKTCRAHCLPTHHQYVHGIDCIDDHLGIIDVLDWFFDFACIWKSAYGYVLRFSTKHSLTYYPTFLSQL